MRSVYRLVQDRDGRTLVGLTIFYPSESVTEDNSSQGGGLLRLTSRGQVDDGFKSELSGFRFDAAPDGTIFDESGARYLADGDRDPRDDQTRVRVDVDLPVDVAAQPDGKKLLLGLQDRANYRRLAVQRFDGHWQLDTTFGTNGTATADVAPGKRLVEQPELHGVLPAPDGAVIGFGLAFGPERSYAFAVKFDATGHLDRSFGDRGRIEIGPPSATTDVHDLAVQPDGSLIAIGFSGPERGRGLFVARYNADGRPDRHFGRTGQVRLGLVRAPRNVNAHELNRDNRDGAITVGPDRTIVGVASLTGVRGSTVRSVAFRLRPDGTLDPSFGRRGVKRMQRLG